MSEQPAINRREFLKITALTGAGLVIGFQLPIKAEALAENSPSEVDFVPNAYLQIDTEGLVTIRVHRSEMGQGVQTAIPMIVADELEADWTKIRVEQAPAASIYGDQVTGGSLSISGSYGTLRAAGAAARTMLIAAAAQTWGVEVGECRAENGVVFHDASGRRLT
jgi:isoquinoline 1-oxidoreductase subunit beta